jgi:AcrR family transcriptional regulator
LSRKQTQAETRRRLLVSSRRLFAERGYHGVSMAAIAEGAGFTTGALYANFRNKADLFLAVIDEDRRETDEATIEALGGDATFESVTRAFGEVFEGRMRTQRGWNLAIVEFLASARSDDAILGQLRDRFARFRAVMASDLAESAAVEERKVAVPPEDVVTLIYAIDFGLAVASFVLADGEDVGDLYRLGVASLFAASAHDPSS